MQKLKALETSNHQLLSCLDYQKAYDAIDFKGLENGPKAEDDDDMPVWGESALSIEDDVATIKVRGLLVPNLGFDATSWGVTGYDVIEYYLDKANNDSNVKSIVLDIDSGGGYVKGCAQAGNAISNSEKPVDTFVSGDMYSAAYWIGSSANSITARESSGIGSIGVYVEHFDRSKALQDRGITARIFKSGFWKGAFSSSQPLSEREELRLQEGIEQSAQKFFDHVADHRNLKANFIKKLDGDVFTADYALNIGLIDAVQTSTSTKIATNSTAMNGQEPIKQNKPQSKSTPLISQEDEDMAATEEQLAQARAEARAEALAEAESQAKAQGERLKQIYALEVHDDVKAVLTDDAFANVPLDKITALVDAMPKGFTAIMDDEGGAGVEANPTEFAEKPDSVIEAEAKEASAQKMQEIDTKGVL